MIFFEKIGCVNGEKQKNILQGAGHTLRCVDILSHCWSKGEILPFIAGKEPMAMMNPTAPDIKSGKIIPAKLSFNEALQLMIESPILIKRPLIEVDGLFIQGFMDERLDKYLGAWDRKEDVITCPNLATISCDEHSGKLK